MKTKEQIAESNLYKALGNLGFQNAGASQLGAEVAQTKSTLESLGFSAEQIASMGIEQKANEVMHTGNSGYGAEFVPSEVLASEIYNLVPKASQLLSRLKGNHGNNLPKTYKAPIIKLSQGDLLFDGKDEWTTGDKITSGDGDRQPTAVCELTQKGFIAKVDISDEQLRYSAVNVEQYIRDRLTLGMAATVDAVMVNGDSETGSTGNVNSDDSAPASGLYYLKIDGGIRERVINGSYNINGGTLDSTDFLNTLKLMGRYGMNPDGVLWLAETQSYFKTMGLAELLTVDKFGGEAAIKTGQVSRLLGAEFLPHAYVPKTEADGKVSATPANNTLGQILCINKNMIQYGFGDPLKIEVVRVPGYGYQLVATFDFAFDIVDSENGLTEVPVAGIRNITL